MPTHHQKPKKTVLSSTMGFLLCVVMSLSCRLTSGGVSPLEQNEPSPPAPTVEMPTITIEAPTPEVPEPTDVKELVPPEGYKKYQDPVLGISVFIPDTWRVSGIVDGQYAIFSSYPEDKYIGGEPRQEGDTKCDLNIQPPGTSPDDLIAQWTSSDITTILAREEITLQSGQTALRFELDSMGRSNLIMTEIRGRVVILNCFGDFSLFDEIASTVHASQ